MRLFNKILIHNNFYNVFMINLSHLPSVRQSNYLTVDMDQYTYKFITFLMGIVYCICLIRSSFQLIYHTMNKTFADCFSVKSLSVLALSLGLAGCGNGSWWSKDDEPTLEVEHIRKAIPSRVNQRESWAKDIYDITEQQGIPQTKANAHTIVAVVQQESKCVADPTAQRKGE